MTTLMVVLVLLLTFLAVRWHRRTAPWKVHLAATEAYYRDGQRHDPHDAIKVFLKRPKETATVALLDTRKEDFDEELARALADARAKAAALNAARRACDQSRVL